MGGGREARAKTRVRDKNAALSIQQRAADAAAVLEKLRLLDPAALRNLDELVDAVQQGEVLQTYLPALAAAIPAARDSLAGLKAQQMEQLQEQMLVLVDKAQAGKTAVEMSGYFGDLFEEGDEDGNAELGFEEFARLMEIIAPSFQGAELRAAFLAAGVAPLPISAICSSPITLRHAPTSPPTPTLLAGRP